MAVHHPMSEKLRRLHFEWLGRRKGLKKHSFLFVSLKIQRSFRLVGKWPNIFVLVGKWGYIPF
jgi:hypothetical protein